MKSKQTQKPLIVSVPQPCLQNWNDMQTVEGGRFCNRCQKTVVDFSGLSEAEVYRYFGSAKTIACGRFRHSQLNIDVHPQEPKPLWYKKIYCYAAALFAVFTLKNTSVSAQTKETTTVQPVMKKNNLDSVTQPVIISGVVKGEDAVPFENAEVSFDSKIVAKTGADGSFSFEILSGPLTKSSVLKISYAGLMAVVRSYHPAMLSTSYNIILEKPHESVRATLGAFIIGFAPQVFEMPIEMTQDLRTRLAALADTLRNISATNVQISAYGTTTREIKLAKTALAAVKTYFVEKEGISEDRFFIKIKPMKKGKRRTVEIEPYAPE